MKQKEEKFVNNYSANYIDLEKQSKKTNLKSFGREGSFLGYIGTYLWKHKLLSFLFFLLVTLSSIQAIFTPKIIQNLVNVVMVENFVKMIPRPSPIPNLFDDNNELVNKIEEFAKNVVIDENGHAYIPLMGIKLYWDGWIYLQLILFAFIVIFTYLSNYVGGIISKRIEVQLRNEALENLVRQDISYYSDKKIGEILTKVVSDTEIVSEQALSVPAMLLSSFITFFGSLAILFTIDWKLSLIIVGIMLVISVSLVFTAKILKKLVFNIRKEITTINGNVIDRIATIRLIKSVGSENQEVEKLKSEHEKYYKKTLKVSRSQAIFVTILIAGISSIQMIVVIAAVLLYKDDDNFLKFSQLLPSFLSGVGAMIGPIFQMTRVMFGIILASTSIYRIQLIVKSNWRLDPHYELDKGIKVDKLDGDIILNDIEFRYPEKPENKILSNLSITFEEGKSYAFVGETGCGKSTIAKLLLRQYDPYAGHVYINGDIDLKDVKLSTYLKFVGYVEQEPQILFGTVLENIMYGNENKTFEEVVEAAKKAELHNIIDGFPQKYDTILGERGFILSGGQKQRLVIARMFLKNPKLLILDEATSALDNIVEREIQSKLYDLMQGRTSITIAHRLSTIKDVDEIIVLGKGEGIVQRGSFNELINVDGHFKDLYEAGIGNTKKVS